MPNLMGNICKWDKIRQIADKYDLVVIEDSGTLGLSIWANLRLLLRHVNN